MAEYLIYSNKLDIKKRFIISNSLLGLIIGITMFISPYYWTAMALLYFLLVFSRILIEKNISFAKENILWFLLTFIPFALTYFLLYLHSSTSSVYVEASEHFGLFVSHWPGSFSNVSLGILASIFIILGWRYLSLDKLFLIASFVLSIFILNWQNVVTGKYLQFSSHYLLVTILYVVFVLAIVSGELLGSEKFKKLPKSLGFAILLWSFVLLVILAYRQKDEVISLFRSYSITRADLIEEQKKSNVFDWLNKNTEPDSVFYTLGGGL